VLLLEGGATSILISGKRDIGYHQYRTRIKDTRDSALSFRCESTEFMSVCFQSAVEKPVPRLVTLVNDSIRVLLPADDESRSLTVVQAPVVALCYIAYDESFYWIDKNGNLMSSSAAGGGGGSGSGGGYGGGGAAGTGGIGGAGSGASNKTSKTVRALQFIQQKR
jgi:uncharacterized membrane protein YgcG